MRKNVCYDNYYDFPFDAAIPKFTAHLCIEAFQIQTNAPKRECMTSELSREKQPLTDVLATF